MDDAAVGGPAGRGRARRRDKRRNGAPDAQKGDVKPWLKKQWCIPEVGAEFVWRMEDVLDLYEEAYEPKRPTVCFDEMPYQLVAEKRIPLPAKPGRPERKAYSTGPGAPANLLVVSSRKGAGRQ